MKNICIIANFEKTFLFSAVLKGIDKKKIFWIVVNKTQKNYLSKRFKTSNILYLPKINQQLKNFIKKKETIKINEIIHSDRSLNDSLSENAEYLVKSKSKIENFIKNKKISFVIGEITWAIEILTFQICKSLNKNKIKVKYLNPASIRLPQNRIIFFDDIQQSTYIKQKKKDQKLSFKFDIEQKQYSNYIKDINMDKDILHYYKKMNNLIFNDYFDKYDPTKTSKISRIKKFISKKINTLLFQFLKKKNLNFFKNKKYIIFFLQKIPEASMDVKGMYYNDNYKNIENVWKILPHNFHLIIKEHPSNIGNLNMNFYKKILKKNKVYLIKNNVDFNKLVKKSYATFSVNSTASLNSSCLGTPSFTFAKCYFNELKNSMKISIEDLIELSLFDLISLNKKKNKFKKNLYKSDFLSNSFKGELFGKNIFDINNLKNLRNSIKEVCR